MFGFGKEPAPSIAREIKKLDEAENEEFGPIKQALLEEVRKLTFANAAKVQNPITSSQIREMEMVGAEEVKGMILGKGQGHDTPRLNLGLKGHYKTGGEAGVAFSLSFLVPDEVDRIFHLLTERFDANTVNALRIKIGKETAQGELGKKGISPERRTTLETFLAGLK